MLPGRAEGLCGCSVTQLEAAQADDWMGISVALSNCTVVFIYFLISLVIGSYYDQKPQPAAQFVPDPPFSAAGSAGQGIMQL